MIGYEDIRKAATEVVALSDEHGDMTTALERIGVEPEAIAQIAVELAAIAGGTLSLPGYIQMGFLVGFQVRGSGVDQPVEAQWESAGREWRAECLHCGHWVRGPIKSNVETTMCFHLQEVHP